MKFVKAAIISSILVFSTSSNAAFDFSNISLTENSITFTIDGDMTGYAPPVDYTNQFSISYYGNFFTLSNDYHPNTWSTSVFDNKTISGNGNTGSWNEEYSWSSYNGILSDAVSTNRTITLSTTQNVFDLNGSGELAFNWGNPNPGSSYITELGRFTVTNGTVAAVPEPSTYALMAGGLGLVGFMAYRRRKSA